MSHAHRNGQIVTFYSYKGGVGRTMALANIAFLAAWNGKRVLIMDWDLEAPGVAYYFRGLLEQKTAKEIKQSEGVLDILWEWSLISENTETKDVMEEFLKPYESGSAFSEKVKGLIDPDLFEMDGIIDYIGAGSKEVKTPTPKPYEEALATFSWKDFYSEKAGGYLLEKWISWAKEHYDFILIDSRTGLADVSGICTMQLPDKVALCFVLNRQNIDGVAKVSSAIRAKRQEQIELKAYAMRVAPRKTSEEDDARARAISELTRIGGFSSSFISESLKNLSVQSDENIPFYETLSFFNTSDPETHTLSVHYLRIAKDLLGQDLLMPKFDSEFISFMRRRLEPTQATVDYIVELKSAQKDRAEFELENLVEKAIQAEADGDDIKIDYILAIIEAVRVAVEQENPIAGYSLTSRILDLLRSQSANSLEWQRLYSLELVRHFETYTGLLDEDEALALLDEIDSIFLQDITHRGTLQRIKYRRKAVEHYINAKSIDSATSALAEVKGLLTSLMKGGGTIQEFSDDIWEAEVDILLKQGDLEYSVDHTKEAVSFWREGYYHSRSKTAQSEVASHYIFELSSRLSNIRPPYLELREASGFALNAIKLGGNRASYTFLSNLPRLIVNASTYEDADLVIEITQTLSALTSFKIQAPIFYGRPGRSLNNFLESVLCIVKISIKFKLDLLNEMEFWAELVDNIFLNFNRRLKALGSRPVPKPTTVIQALANHFEEIGIDTFKYIHLTVARSQPKKDVGGPKEVSS